MPFNARFAPGLMSTVWIVPFLICFDVTTMVAAVPLAPPLRRNDCGDRRAFKVRSFPAPGTLLVLDATNRNDAPYGGSSQ